MRQIFAVHVAAFSLVAMQAPPGSIPRPTPGPLAQAPAPVAPADAALEARIQRVHGFVAPAIACIYETLDGYDESEPIGAAVVVSAEGLVVTAAHCLGEPGQVIELVLGDGRTVEAKTLGKNHDHDLGLLEIQAEGPFAYIGINPLSHQLVRDEVVLMYGYPDEIDADQPAVVRVGTFLGTHQSGQLRTSCTMMPGDSGGPLVDLDGCLVGINTEVDLPLDQNYHASSALLMRHWKKLLASKVIGEDPFDAYYAAESDELDASDAQYEFEPLSREAALSESALRAREQVAPALPDGDFDPSKLMLGGRPGLAGRFGAVLGSVGAAKVTSRNAKGSSSALGVYCGDGRGGPGPFVVSKSSIVRDGWIRCTLPDGTLDKASVIRRDESTDLVLLRLANAAAPATTWTAPARSVASFVASIGQNRPNTNARVLSAGVLGAGLHGVSPRDWGYLDAEPSGFEGAAILDVVHDGGAADQAGLSPGDVLRAIDGLEVPRLTDLDDFMDESRPGQTVDVVFMRKGERMETKVELSSWAIVNDEYWATTHVAYMQPRSLRRGRFGAVYRHDAHVEPSECGGPLVNLEGKVIGLNIARADRTGTLALPASAVAAFIAEGLQR